MAVQDQAKADQLRVQLDSLRKELGVRQTKINAYSKAIDSLEVRHQEVYALQIISEQLDVLTDSPLDTVSPFTGTKNTSALAGEEYAVYKARIEKQVSNFKTQLKDIKSKRQALVVEAEPLRSQINDLVNQLKVLSPGIQENIVYTDGVKVNVQYRSDAILPWANSVRDTWRKRIVNTVGVLVAVLLCLLIARFEVPPRPIPEVVEIPPRLAKLLQKKKVQPPVVKKDKKSEEKKEPEKKKAEPKAPKPKKEVVRPANRPQPQVLNPSQQKARERAQQSGIFASSSFSNLLDSDEEKVLGKQARVTSGGDKSSKTTRSILTSKTGSGSGSGGVQTSGLSKDTASTGGGLKSRGTSKVDGVIGGSDFANADRPVSGSRSFKGGRTDEEIQIVFDRGKSALYGMYQRALRTDPTLEGKVVIRLTIEPSGKVSAASIVSSGLNDAALERRIIFKVKSFNFGAKDVPKITINYPIDFIPG